MVMRVFGDGGELLVVADEASVLEDPGEGPLDHPAPRHHLEAFDVGAAADDLQGDVGLFGGPMNEATGVAAIGKDAGDEGVALAGAFER